MIVRILSRKAVPIPLHAGTYSRWFVDGKQIFNDTYVREIVLDYWAKYLDYAHNNVRLHFRAVATGGISWAAALSDRIKGSSYSTYVPGTRVDHSKQVVFVVDDVLTTGTSIKVVCKSQSGLHRALVVVDRRSPYYTDQKYGFADDNGIRLGSGHIITVTSWARVPLPTFEA